MVSPIDPVPFVNTGIFLVSERKIGQDYAKSRIENEKLKQMTMEITKKYLAIPNTIVLVVISSTDWIHGKIPDPDVFFFVLNSHALILLS